MKGLGWLPDVPDIRDHILFSTRGVIKAKKVLPMSVDLSVLCPSVYDQGHIGSCTAQSVSALYQFLLKKQDALDPLLSRMFLYYVTREAEGTQTVDRGATLRSTLKAINTYGICTEPTWEYVVDKLFLAPEASAYLEAEKFQTINYKRLEQDLEDMRGCLSAGYPFVFGFAVYDKFMSEYVRLTGIGSLPQPGDIMTGGHAVMAVGYNDNTQTFLIRNSWGDSWGMSGYFTLPYNYLTDVRLAADFWTIELVEAGV